MRKAESEREKRIQRSLRSFVRSSLARFLRIMMAIEPQLEE